MKTRVLVIVILALCLVESVSAQWTQLVPPQIQIPLSPNAILAKGDTLWVGMYRGTIYRSTNNGLNWARSDSGISYLYCTNDFLTAGDTIFAMAEEGIFRSTDMGVSWAIKNNGLPIASWMNVYSMVQSGNFLFAATDFGVYRSSNGGDQWYPSTGDSVYWPVYSLAVSNGLLFAGTSGKGVYLSTDHGNSWSAINNGMPANPTGYVLQVNKLLIDGENIYAGIAGLGVYQSSNNGSTWLPDTAGLNKMNNGNFFPICSLAKVGTYIYAGTENDGIYRMPGNGGPWTHVNAGMPAEAYVTSIRSTGGILFAAVFSSGIYYSSSEDPIAWVPLFTEFPGTVNVGLVASNGNNLFIGAASNYYNGTIYNIYRSYNTGSSWILDSVLSSGNIFSFESYGDSVYALGNSLFFSLNDGTNWSEPDSNLISPNTLIKYDDTLFVGWGDNRFSVGEFGGIALSANNGASWKGIWNKDTAVFALAKIGNDLFAGGLHGAFRSTNSGLSWAAIDSGLPSSLEVYGFNTVRNNLFACTLNGIYWSSNHGNSWSAVNNGLPIDSGGNAISLITNNSELLAGTTSGIFSSTNLGASWSSASYGLSGDALNIQSLTVLGNDLFLIAATKGGLWARPLAEGVFVQNGKDVFPKEFYLGQNYPNPFNPSTVISYQLPANTRVTLKVYDELGRVVRTLVNERQTAGSHSVTFDASNLSSGAYFYRLSAGSFVQTKKLILLK